MNSLAMSVSVIVLTYKQSDVLNLIIEALDSQTYQGDYEVIISDDGSTEEFVAKNLSMLRKSKLTFKYVWQQDKGYRASTARNNGISLAKNELLIFLDGDIVPHPDFIQKHVNHHQMPGRLVAGNRTWVGQISEIKSLAELQGVEPDPVARKRGSTESELRHEWLASINPWKACFSANLSVRKAHYVSFDDRFVGWGPDDAEFCYRLCVKHGLIPIYDETIGAYHLEEPAAVGNVFRKNNHLAIVDYIRNTFLFFDLCPGLSIEDVFYGFIRLRLDKPTNTWSAVPRSEILETDLEKIVTLARKWLIENHDNYFAPNISER